MHSLKDLYIDQLQDVWSANEQARKFTEKLCEAANDNKLCDTLSKSQDRIKQHNERLEKMIRSYDASPSAEHCKGMEGLIAEAKKHALQQDYTDDAVRDAQIISQFQRITHYGIAAYGTCRAMAEELGHSEDARILAEDLQEVRKGDEVLSHIAKDSVNRRAA